MLASMLRGIAIPEAFGDRALLLVGGYLGLQFIRNAFMVLATARASEQARPPRRRPSPHLRRRGTQPRAARAARAQTTGSRRGRRRSERSPPQINPSHGSRPPAPGVALHVGSSSKLVDRGWTHRPRSGPLAQSWAHLLCRDLDEADLYRTGLCLVERVLYAPGDSRARHRTDGGSSIRACFQRRRAR